MESGATQHNQCRTGIFAEWLQASSFKTLDCSRSKYLQVNINSTLRIIAELQLTAFLINP